MSKKDDFITGIYGMKGYGKSYHETQKEVKRLNKEIERLTAESTEWESKFYNEAKKVDKAIEYITHYETIRGYYEYQELGYDEYNYDEDLKQELLEILGDEDE